LGGVLQKSSYGYGNAFEHFVILECFRLNEYYRAQDRFYYLRTKDDAEIDLIIERSQKEIWAVEIKSSQNIDSVEIEKTLALAKDLKPKRIIIVSNVERARTVGKVEILNWKAFLEQLYPG
jgi:predicted AAA+ superfamily ATPase